MFRNIQFLFRTVIHRVSATRGHCTHLTSWMTCSRAAVLTSSPFIAWMWSPGNSLSRLGPSGRQERQFNQILRQKKCNHDARFLRECRAISIGQLVCITLPA